MCGLMTVGVEVLAFAADRTGIYSINGGAGGWVSDPIRSDSSVHWEVEGTLREHSIPEELWMALHSTSATEPGSAWPSPAGAQWTSWRPKDAMVVLTYAVLVAPPGEYVLDTWPDALPVSAALAEFIGQPESYDPTMPPLPRNGDVMLHLLRTVKGLLDTDDDNAAAAGPLWASHLGKLAPAFARMYHRAPTKVAANA